MALEGHHFAVQKDGKKVPFTKALNYLRPFEEAIRTADSWYISYSPRLLINSGRTLQSPKTEFG